MREAENRNDEINEKEKETKGKRKKQYSIIRFVVRTATGGGKYTG